MDNEKWTHEVKNNDLADGLEDCKIFENTLDNNLDKKTEENKNEKDGEITADELKKAQEDVQKTTDKYVKEIDTLVDAKEADIMAV